MQMETLRDLALHGLMDIYDAEHQITQALPKMMQAAHNSQLKQSMQMHLEQTQDQIRRLEQCFEMMGQKPQRKKCMGMQGLIEEGQEIIKESKGGDPNVLDAGLIAAQQKVEHYEIAAYGTARTYAEMLGMRDCAQILESILEEEKMTDQKLTQLAESHVNVQANQ